MYLYNLPSKMQSLLAVLIAATLTFLFHFILMNFFMNDYRENREQIQTYRYLYSRLHQEFIQIDSFTENAKQNKYQKNQLDFFSGNSNEAIQAKVLNRVKFFAIKNGAQFRTSRQLPKKNNHLGIRVGFYGKLDAIKKTLHAIETSRPFLIVEKLHLKPLLNHLNKSHKNSIMLNTQIDVYGIIWSEQK